MNRVAACQPECSAAELKDAGFSAHELRLAGFDLFTLKDIGFNLAQLKAAGFLASEFKLAGHELGHLKEAGFTAKECKEADFGFASLQMAGFNAKELKDAGFNASEFKNNGTKMSLTELRNAGFSAREILYPESHTVTPAQLCSSHSQAQDPRLVVRGLIDEKVASARIFGDSWRSRLGFFMPFGTQNSFWNRLQCSPMLRHFFIHDARFDDDLCNRSLTEESPSPKVTVNDVDSAVNNCALICALLLSIPTGIISNLSEDSFVTMMASQAINTQHKCQQLDYTNLQNTAFSEDCVSQFKTRFIFLYNNCIMCFYSSLFTLVTAVLYYMCRPSPSYNNASNVTLLNAFTLIVRQDIRKEMRSFGTELPEEPFENRILESEVFMKAKFLAENEAEEQMNQV